MYMNKDELDKCKNYMSYFIERYCTLLTPNGIENIRLLNSQKKSIEYLNKYDTRRQRNKLETI